ncbi:MAG: hypothetical protein M0036_07175 [Desulfobacteraceae bacterium]|nr:hypothetical protein [Desulfobacteraceae bacterium]
MNNFRIHSRTLAQAFYPGIVKGVALSIWLLLLCWASPALALEMFERNPFYVYFPDDQSQLASRLLTACEPMTEFIKAHGLEVPLPIHVVVDENLDLPRVGVETMPHHQIRIPLRAPGVLEDGGNEADPWSYFLFMGLASQAIHNERSGIPGALHTLFGEVSSPNLILPEWGVDGIAFLLYEKYQSIEVKAPMADSIFTAGPIPDLDRASNHPDVWPGRLSHRIYGRPFIAWLDEKYGWEKVLAVIQLHGRGLIPIEIDNEARAVFGQSWDRVWQDFKKDHDGLVHNGKSLPIVGYWDHPFIYWNDVGVHPGLQSEALRGRYGFMDAHGWLRLSEYDAKGVCYIKIQRNASVIQVPQAHMWDPGPGDVAVTRRGSRPVLVLNASAPYAPRNGQAPSAKIEQQFIEAPPDVLELSGPMADVYGRIAVAANTAGNWDIWLYDGTWHRITSAPSVEMDPWLENDQLIFASNISGRFQIHNHDLQQLTDAPTAAVLPRHKTFLYLKTNGWQPMVLPAQELPPLPLELPPAPGPAPPGESVFAAEAKKYSPLKSIWPNYVMPDLFADLNNFQIGVSTRAEDVTKQYAWDAGVRYSPNDDLFSWRWGGQAKDWNTRATRYPFGYTTSRMTTVDELRTDIKLGWSPQIVRELELALNWRYYEDLREERLSDDEWWSSLSYRRTFDRLRTSANVDLFAENSQSLYGELSYRFGQRISTVVQFWGGKTWGDLKAGHNTFRIGGNSAEGYFTQRPTRLFPLRGFANSFLDAGQAATLGIETFWPLASLQSGYKMVPLFLRNISIGTFADSGFASQHLSSDEILASAGFELITGMELAWGYMADFRMGWAWPLRKPADVDQSGPVFLIQIGRPL